MMFDYEGDCCGGMLRRGAATDLMGEVGGALAAPQTAPAPGKRPTGNLMIIGE